MPPETTNEQTNGDTKVYVPVDPDPNRSQAVGTALTAAGFVALASDPSTGDTVESAMTLMALLAERVTATLAILGIDTYVLGLILVGVGTLLNIYSLAKRPREHFLSKEEQVRRRQVQTEDPSVRPSPA